MLRRQAWSDIRSWPLRLDRLPALKIGGIAQGARRGQAPPLWIWLRRWRIGEARTPTREGYALAAVVLVGFGSSLVAGRYSRLALLAIVLGLLAAALVSAGSDKRAQPWAWCLAVFLGAVSTGFLLHGPSLLSWVAPIVGGLGAVVAISARPWLWRTSGAVVAGLPGLAGVIKSLILGHVDVDVFEFTQRAAGQLLRGQDPYRFSYPTTTAHLALAHYFYLPGVVLLSIPGRLIGDVRVSDVLAAAAIVAAVTVLARRHGGGEQAWRCLALCLTLPFFPLMIEFGWVEIYPLLAVALWLLFRAGHRFFAVLALGVGMATVPTGWPILVLPFLWWRRPRGEILGAVAVAVAICLPFAIWSGVGNFVYSTLLINIHLPPWPTGLDLDVAFRQFTGAWLPSWVWPVLAAVTLLVVARVRRRNWPNAFYLGSAFLLVVFIAAKWSTFNYYFLAVMGLILAVALEPAAEPVPPRILSARPEGALPEGREQLPAAEQNQIGPALP